MSFEVRYRSERESKRLGGRNGGHSIARKGAAKRLENFFNKQPAQEKR